MKRLLIEPLDVLMFRNERPFTARETHVAKTGIISPLTFEGAIKSKIFVEFCKIKGYSVKDFQRGKGESENTFKSKVVEIADKDEEVKRMLKGIGHPAMNSESSLKVLGVFFYDREKQMEYFPIPKDIVSDGGKNYLKLNPIVNEEFKITGTEEYLCAGKYSKVEDVNGLISSDKLMAYFRGEEPKENWFIKKPYELELRSGIELEKEPKKTAEGCLYSAEFLRLKVEKSNAGWKESWCFSVWVDDPENLLNTYFKENMIIRLGGEGRGAICKSIEDVKEKFKEIVESINNEKRFKLYLASQSYFEGWKPPQELLKKALGTEAKLVAALPGKPIYIGGFDFGRNQEKPLRRWVDAGAVYFFDGKIREDLNIPVKIIDGEVNMRCAFIGRW